MYDHIGLHVKDLKSALRFYKASLEPLGFVPDGSGCGFGPKGQPGLWLYEGKGGPVHVAFRAADRQAVDRFYAAGLKAGSTRTGTTWRPCA